MSLVTPANIDFSIRTIRIYNYLFYTHRLLLFCNNTFNCELDIYCLLLRLSNPFNCDWNLQCPHSTIILQRCMSWAEPANRVKVKCSENSWHFTFFVLINAVYSIIHVNYSCTIGKNNLIPFWQRNVISFFVSFEVTATAAN